MSDLFTTDELEASSAMSCSARFTLSLGHSGDYPGYPCASVNGRPLGDEKWALLLSMFGLPNGGYADRRKLFDKIGMQLIPGSVEHYPWEGEVEITLKPNS